MSTLLTYKMSDFKHLGVQIGEVSHEGGEDIFT